MESTEHSIFVRARFVYASLPKAERGAADLLFDIGKEAATFTLAEYARRADSSESSVIRFCRRIGAAGYAEFARLLAVSSEPPEGHGIFRISAADDLRSVFTKVANNYRDTLMDTLALYSDEYERALDAITKARTLHFLGIGDAHLVCQAAQMKFTRVGKPATAPSDTAMVLSTGTLADKDDVIVAISFTGRTKLLTTAARLARENGATVIAIIHNEKSQLAKLANIKLFTATTDLTPAHDEIARRIAEHAIIDTLYMAMTRRNQATYGERGERSIDAIETYK